LVLCRNGEFLINPGEAGRWMFAKVPYTMEMIDAGIAARDRLSTVRIPLANRPRTSRLDVNDRTVRRWLSGHDEPRPGVWNDPEQLLDERIGAAAEFSQISTRK
jgi:hypothetical protein